MIWEKIRGHADQVAMFRRSLARGRLSHAYLFVGPDGVGKRSFAGALAQCLFCERFADTELEACGECAACRQMSAGTHPDFVTVGCPPGKRELPIELIAGERESRGREGLCHELALRPMNSARKIAVLDDADLLNPASGNALLKTLEEPPDYALLILISSNPDGLLPTIRSRCQQVRFAALSATDVAELLLEQELVQERAEAELTAALSEGSLATAGRLLAPGLRELRTSLFESLAENRFDAVRTSKRILAELDEIGGEKHDRRVQAGWVVRYCIEFFRRVLLALSVDDEEGVPEPVLRFASRLDRGSADDLDRVAAVFDRGGAGG